MVRTSSIGVLLRACAGDIAKRHLNSLRHLQASRIFVLIIRIRDVGFRVKPLMFNLAVAADSAVIINKFVTHITFLSLPHSYHRCSE